MSIREFVSSLTLEQLEFAKECIDCKLNEVKSKDKVTLYLVSGTVVNEGCYTVDNFDQAKQHLSRLILEDKFDEKGLNYGDIPTIQRVRVYPDEVASYMELNK